MTTPDDDLWSGADLIYAYTRAQAIEDGVLIDVSALAREAGFKFHTVITANVHASAVTLTPAAKLAGCDERGRLWDVLWMASLAARKARRDGTDTDRVAFHVLVVRDDYRRPESVPLVLHIGPGDTPEPVLTIMTPWED